MVSIENVSVPTCCSQCFLYSGSSEGICLIGDYGDPKHINCIVDIDREDWCPMNDLGDISNEELNKKLTALSK